MSANPQPGSSHAEGLGGGAQPPPTTTAAPVGVPTVKKKGAQSAAFRLQERVVINCTTRLMAERAEMQEIEDLLAAATKDLEKEIAMYNKMLEIAHRAQSFQHPEDAGRDLRLQLLKMEQSGAFNNVDNQEMPGPSSSGKYPFVPDEPDN